MVDSSGFQSGINLLANYLSLRYNHAVVRIYNIIQKEKEATCTIFK
jgi:hypothetical protein